MLEKHIERLPTDGDRSGRKQQAHSEGGRRRRGGQRSKPAGWATYCLFSGAARVRRTGQSLHDLHRKKKDNTAR